MFIIKFEFWKPNKEKSQICQKKIKIILLWILKNVHKRSIKKCLKKKKLKYSETGYIKPHFGLRIGLQKKNSQKR